MPSTPRSREAIEDADPDAVHRVRTGSRRLQAMLEAMLREAGPAARALERPARAWLRELKQVRRAAGPVRDLDVQRKLLENWVGKQAPEQDASAWRQRGEPDPHARRNESRRKCSMRGSKASASTWRMVCRSRSGSGSRDWRKGRALLYCDHPCSSGQAEDAVRPADAVALEDFVRAADAMPLLDAENLHDFRKATKKARYVAEAGAEGRDTAAWPRR